MASGFNNTNLNIPILNHLFGLTPDWTAPSHLWIGLSTANPTDAGSGLAEPSGNSYARVQLDPGSTNWLITNETVNNKSAITFPTASGAGWGTVTYAVLFDAATSGDQLAYFLLTSSQAVAAGQTVQFNIGDFNITQA